MGTRRTAAQQQAEPKRAPSPRGRTGLGLKRAGAARGRMSLPQQPVTPERRLQLIAEAAYFRALGRGFGKGREEQDWLEAEAEVDARLRSA